MTAQVKEGQFNSFSFEDLHQLSGLRELDSRFVDGLRETAPDLAERLTRYRETGTGWPNGDVSALLIDLAPYLEAFVAELFGIESPLAASHETHAREAPVLRFKQEFVQRRGRRYRGKLTLGLDEVDAWLCARLDEHEPGWRADPEGALGRYAMGLLADEQANAQAVDRVSYWCSLARSQPAAARVRGWSSFRLPQKVDHARLVPMVLDEAQGFPRLRAPDARLRHRDGFTLTDERWSRRDVLAEVDYCIYCHDHQGDFCSIGFPEKKGQPELGLKVDPLGVTLTGCPLDEKISEMHVLKRDGYVLGALAVAMVDNPMVPATGHRICNDCMKGCIYQKQDPVNIPQIETRVLTDVLDLPWGVEIYDLLTRWNPLRAEQYLPRPYSGRRVLIAGMGPAGFTMAHYLTMEGCAVVGIEGLKVEPLPEGLINAPVRDWSDLTEPLDERILLGFGGVAEYGITVRWDKNFLKLIYLTLARRAAFQVFGGVRLGGTVTLEDAWELGFDHVCIATGAGYPKVLPMGNSLARGMRQANDFLMALQLTGAGKDSSIANLQVRLPAVVIGGGLTGVDTATEVQAYYIKQVEKTLDRCERLVAERGEEAVRRPLNEEDQTILDEFLEHGRAVRAERARAAAEGRAPDFIPLLHQWGGVTIAYRKGMNASPAYVRNHEELIKATEEGLFYAEGLEPIHATLDRYGCVSQLVCRRMRSEGGRWFATGHETTLPARAIFVAAGTVPNTIYEHEYPGSLVMEDNHYQPHVEHTDGLQPVTSGAQHCKSDEFGPFTSYSQGGHNVTFLGDTHPVFHGSVVKAIASSQRSYRSVVQALEHLPPSDSSWRGYQEFRARMAEQFTARVIEIDRSNPAVVELWVKAPLAARRFRPGQFFRLQTFETGAPVVEGTRLQVPLMTVSGTGVRGDLIRLMVLQWGAAPRLVGRLDVGDELVLMGPTGAPAHMPERQTVMVVAGRWGAAVMHDIGTELRRKGNRVLYVAAFGGASEVDHQDELEACADQIIWATATEQAIPARRPQDLSVQATDMVDLVRQYGDGELRPQGNALPLQSVTHVVVMGGTGLLRGFQQAMNGALKGYFAPGVRAIGTVGSPMQCMLKGVCAQCLQWQVDPDTGKRTRAVFSCSEQDQPLAWIDLDNLAARQQQNRLADMLGGQWVDYVLGRATEAKE